MSNIDTQDVLIKFENDLVKVRDFIQNFQKELDWLQEELRKKEDETQDLLHYMELKFFNASEGYRIADDMRKIRQERREMKDLLDLMKVANVKINGNFGNVNALNEAIGEVRKANSNKKLRRYNPRIRKDLANDINNQRSKRIKVNK